MLRRTPAERIDAAVEGILAGRSAGEAAAAIGADDELRPLVAVAAALRSALPTVPVGSRFEVRLAERLSQAGLLQRGVHALRHPNRLLVTGAAVSSAAVGVGVYAVWRSTRRPSGHRLLTR